MTIIVCAPPVYLHRRITHYPTCQRRRRFSGREQLWYGTTWTCLGCGDSWTDGERQPRPFRRGWRAEAVAAARRDWEQAGRFDRAAHRAWVEEQLGQLDTPAVEPAVSELPPPLAVLDSRCEDWPPPNLSDVMGWLRSNGINTKVTYRVELYLVDTLFAKVFQYQRDEHGRMICNVDHDHRNNPDQCEAARREPYLLPLNNMPPTPNGGDQ